MNLRIHYSPICFCNPLNCESLVWRYSTPPLGTLLATESPDSLRTLILELQKNKDTEEGKYHEVDGELKIESCRGDSKIRSLRLLASYDSSQSIFIFLLCRSTFYLDQMLGGFILCLKNYFFEVGKWLYYLHSLLDECCRFLINPFWGLMQGICGLQ